MHKLLFKTLIISIFTLSVVSSASAGLKKKMAIAAGGLVVTGVVKGCLQSTQCRATGTKKAGKLAVTIVQKYGPDTVKACMAKSSCMNTLLASVTAGSANIPLLQKAEKMNISQTKMDRSTIVQVRRQMF